MKASCVSRSGFFSGGAIALRKSEMSRAERKIICQALAGLKEQCRTTGRILLGHSFFSIHMCVQTAVNSVHRTLSSELPNARQPSVRIANARNALKVLVLGASWSRL